jgi:hypothetical protein
MTPSTMSIAPIKRWDADHRSADTHDLNDRNDRG